MPMHPLETRLAAAWPPETWRDVTVLLAVSGGPDSISLLRAATVLKAEGPGRLVAAHFNHRLRGQDSDADEAFVLELCDRLGVGCAVGRAPADRLAVESADGLEAAARTARYEFLSQAAARYGARYVATAHTADDQVETILHRILRGTGIGGLAGMAPARPLALPSVLRDEPPGEACSAPLPASVTLIRPLLAFRRAELLAYLDNLGQPYRRDPSNDDVRFTRNRIRHELLPHLASALNPGVADALLRLGTLAAEVQGIVDTLVEDLVERHVAIEGPGAVRIGIVGLAAQPRYLIRELLIAAWRRQGWPMQSMGFDQWDLLAAMASAGGQAGTTPPAKQTFPGNVLAEVVADWLRLVRLGG